MASATTTGRGLDAAFLRGKHEAGSSWEEYLASNPEKARPWRDLYQRITLQPPQRTLISSFVREMKVLCISGIWCGDCVQQGPLLQRIAEASPKIDLRWLDRDEHMDLGESVRINGGLRVPVVLFLAEDFEPVSVFGDRTLTRYRALAAKHLGPSCPLPGAAIPEDELRGTLQDWLNEFERVHLLLRLSARLREKYRD